MITFKRKLATSAIAMSLLSVGAVASVAATPNNLVAASDQQQRSTQVSDAQLIAFAEVSVTLEEIQQKYQNMAQNVQTEEQLQQLQQDANREMIEAVEQTTLSVEQYNDIVTALQASPETQQRLVDLVNQQGQ